MSISAGTRLGPYEIQSPLGAGGMGEVYRARDPRLARSVAIKVLPASLASDSDRLRRFEQEARATGSLNHPNVLAIYDVGSYNGAPYIVSELLEGETLRARLSGWPISPRKAIEYGIQIARGLAAAHDKGVIHRDLKPENLFLTTDGRMKVLDFGLAKLIEPDLHAGGDSATLPSHTTPGTVMGTMGYMSPEQVRGAETDARSDIFAFGAILYEMLCGCRAFQRATSADTISAILKEDPPELNTATRQIPPVLERVVRHCLEKNPNERFQSARDLAFNLEALTSASGMTSDIKLPAEKRRSWAVPGLVAILVLAAIAAAVLWRRSARRYGAPEFRQVTFRSGTVYRARFAHDGQTILYAAGWEGKPSELFTSRYGSTESHSLATETSVAAVSSKGQLAVLLNPTFSAYGSICFPKGTLALLPMDGGAARPVMDGVEWADWTPDGSDLAVIRSPQEAAGNALELPRGKVLYTPERGWISDVRFSPDGKNLALGEHVPFGDDGKVVVIDRSGRKIVESPHYNSVNGVAWAPNGEVWYTAANESSRGVIALDMRGRTREIYHAPSDMTIHDIAADGRVLITNDNSRMLMLAGGPGRADKNLSWLNWSLALDISDDGSTAVFSESSTGVGGTSAVFLRKLDGSPAVMLGEGVPMALSPDGKWVAALDNKEPSNILLLPTGVGNPEQLTSNGWDYGGIRWMKDGKSLIVRAREPNHKPRLYSIDVSTKAMHPLLPEGITGGWPSPDGRYLLAVQNHTLKLFTSDGQEVRSFGKLGETERIDKWSGDGKAILRWSGDRMPKLERIDAVTGQISVVGEIRPPEMTGVVNIVFPESTPDGKAYVYSEYRLLTDLFVAAGLH